MRYQLCELQNPAASGFFHTDLLHYLLRKVCGGCSLRRTRVLQCPKQSVGSSYFDSADSFGMIRGRHIDVAIMGGLEVDEAGNLANWAVPGKPLLGVGGAMDLASGAKKLIITLTHTNPDGSSKLVPACTLPLTAMNAVDLVITDLAVFSYEAGQLTLIELMPGITLDHVRAKTSATFVERLG